MLLSSACTVIIAKADKLNSSVINQTSKNKNV